MIHWMSFERHKHACIVLFNQLKSKSAVLFQIVIAMCLYTVAPAETKGHAWKVILITFENKVLQFKSLHFWLTYFLFLFCIVKV